MNGATPVAEAGLLNAGTGWQIIGTADFNNDGNSDLLFRNIAVNQSAIWLMNGTHVQAERQPQVSASRSAAASTLTAANPLSAAPVLGSADTDYPAASAGPDSLSHGQLATSTTPGLGVLPITQV